MKVAIDTSSLISLVRYYLKFDSSNKLFDIFKDKIEEGEIIIIDKVLDECMYTSKKIVVTKLDYLTDKDWKKEYKVLINTDSIIPPTPIKFHRIVDNQMINTTAKNSLNDQEYEIMKEEFLNSADGRLIIFALDFKKKFPDEEFHIVTEETDNPNDNKPFKKIPLLGKIVNLSVINLPELMVKYPKIDVSF